MGRKSRKADIDFIAICKQWHASSQGQKKPTINDVASLAGVSKKTVSRVINNSEYVNAGTRLAIQQIIKGIGYYPDPQARGLAFRRSFLVGLIYDNPTPQYVVNIQLGILDAMRDTDYELVVHPCNRKSEQFLDDARRFIEIQKLHGVILTPSVSEDEQLAEVLREIGCAYIRIASVELDKPQHMIVTNDRVGGAIAANHIVELGHKHIAMVEGRHGFRSSFERRAGFEEGLAEHGITLDKKYILQGDYTFDSGLQQGARLLDLDPRPTAVFTANDEMAAGVLQAARFAGVSTPDKLSVVGYDDFEIATRIWPRLTTVHSPTRDIGEMAARRLLKLDPTDPDEPLENQTRPHLVERDSTSKKT